VNKVVLVVVLLLLAVCAANTYLLVQLVGALQSAGEKIHSAAKEMEKVQPLLKEVKDKLANGVPGKPPPIGPGEPKEKQGGNLSDSPPPEPKLPPSKPPVPPGPLPK
jgi:hypothetical protein